MQQYLNPILYVVVLLCLNSCVWETKRVGNESVIIKRCNQTAFSEGKLKSKIHYINDTVMHGIAKYYYCPSEVLKDEMEFNHGVKEGWHKHYRKDGTLKSKAHFKNGLPDGDTYWYYPDGTLKEHTQSVKGQQFGLAEWYYPNGQLELLNNVDFWGDAMYIIRYDEQGNKIQEDGVVFSPYYWYVPHRDSMPVNGETFIQIAVAEPPETKTTIRMGELGKELKQLTVNDYIITYQDTFKTTGKHTLVTIGEIHDMQGNLIRRDSITTEITVIE